MAKLPPAPKLDAGSDQPRMLRQHAREVAFAVGNTHKGLIYVTPTGQAETWALPDLAAQLLLAGGVTQGLFPEGTATEPGIAFIDYPGTGLRPTNGGGTLEVRTNEVISLQTVAPALAVNYPVVAGSATGDAVTYTAWGDDASIGVVVKDRGGAGVLLVSNEEMAFKADAPLNAVNWIGVRAATAGNDALLYAFGDTNAGLKIEADGAGGVTVGSSTNTLGFFGATPVAKPTGVGVTAADIHAALVSLGLIAP